jgi:5,10-methylenetetrahydromethanopterin reductase
MEFWRAGGIQTSMTASEAQAIEADGWDGQMVMDSSCLTSDPYVIMTALALQTEKLLISPGVTNPVSRHPAVTACAAMSLQNISGGRYVLGIGRGDSALAFLGHGPASVAVFEKALRDIQTLMSGGAVAFDPDRDFRRAPSIASMGLRATPDGSRLKWLPAGLPKVEMDVAATGPRVIALSARIAERVTFSVGASPERVAWALELARSARAEAGLPADGISYGVQIIVVPTRHKELAGEWARTSVGSLARFQVIQGENQAPASAYDQSVFTRIHNEYDMNYHGGGGRKLPDDVLTAEFNRSFAMIGTPGECVERLLTLNRMGIDRFVIVGASLHPESHAEERRLFTREVLPALRAESGV